MRPINRYLSNKIKASDIKATDKTIHQIVKAELDRLGHDADLNHIDVSEVTNMNSLFGYLCHNLSYDNINPDISKWDVSNATDMDFMFYEAKMFNCDIANWAVSKVKNMGAMFCYCENFNQDISQWDVRNVKNMIGMFEGCINFNQDLSRWDVNKVENYTNAFKDCPIKEEYKPKFNI